MQEESFLNQNEIAPSNSEHESKPKVSVVFHGFTHSSANLQAIDKQGQRLEEARKNTNGRVVVFLEGSDLTSSWEEKFRKSRKEFGGLHNLLIADVLFDRTKSKPPVSEIERIGRKIHPDNIDGAIAEGLLRRKDIQKYFQYKMIEEHAQNNNVDIAFETHPKPTVDRVKKIGAQQDAFAKQALTEWLAGNFEGALELDRRNKMLLDQAAEIRNQDIIQRLKELVKKLLREKEGGTLLIFFGKTHVTVLDAVDRKLGPNVPVSYSISGYSPSDSVVDRISSLYPYRAEAPDETIARDFLGRLCRIYLQDEFEKRKKLSLYAQNYEDIDNEIGLITSNLSLEELRRMCTNKINIREFVLNHPSMSISERLLRGSQN